VIEQLQGAPIPASVLETEVLPARIQRYHPADLDTLCGAGEVIWRGLEPLGAHDGRIALYLPGRYPLLAKCLLEAGFTAGSRGYLKRKTPSILAGVISLLLHILMCPVMMRFLSVMSAASIIPTVARQVPIITRQVSNIAHPVQGGSIK